MSKVKHLLGNAKRGVNFHNAQFRSYVSSKVTSPNVNDRFPTGPVTVFRPCSSPSPILRIMGRNRTFLYKTERGFTGVKGPSIGVRGEQVKIKTQDQNSAQCESCLLSECRLTAHSNFTCVWVGA